jgi:NAD-dependent histone deacetylase SIR2
LPLQDFRSTNGLYRAPALVLENGATMPTSELFDLETLRNPDRLLAYGRFMANMRMQARSAPSTPCHALIAQLHDAGRLLRCYTQNIDGLQTRDRMDMSEVVLELHGSARLKCHLCCEYPSEDAQKLDLRMVQEGKISCSECPRRGRSMIHTAFPCSLPDALVKL